MYIIYIYIYIIREQRSGLIRPEALKTLARELNQNVANYTSMLLLNLYAAN
jgi:hypothetical protein